MTRDELLIRFPNASEAFIKNNAFGLCADDPKPVERRALVGAPPRENAGGNRLKIRFTIFATRPADWDNYDVKELQDALIHSGSLDGDAWNQLSGEIRSEKVHTKAEEKTVIEIGYE